MLVTKEPGQEIKGLAASVKCTVTTQFAVFCCASVAANATCRIHEPAAPKKGHQGKRSLSKLVSLRVAEDGPVREPVIDKDKGLLSVAVGTLPVVVCVWRAKGVVGSCVNETKISLQDQIGDFTSLKQFGPSQPEIAVLHWHV
jgi:hypothetical protein